MRKRLGSRADSLVHMEASRHIPSHRPNRPAPSRPAWPRLLAGLLVIGAALVALAVRPAASMAACANPIACENAKTGDDPSTWQIFGAGEEDLQGYATQMSVNKGQTINFKIKAA